MHNPKQSGLTSIRDALLSAELTDGLRLSRVRIPNSEALVPPGYYVSSVGESGPCGHCGAMEPAHLEVQRYCPVPPLEFRAEERVA